MKGIIVAVHGKKAVLLKENGQFVQIANRGYEIGQKISPPCLRVRQWASVAAVFVFLCIGSFSFAYYTPTATMRLTINPDFSLVLNCFNHVIYVEALNEDAVTVLSHQPKIRGNSADCITKIVEAAAEEGYLSEKNAMVRIAADTKKAPVAEKAREAICQSVDNGDLPAFVEICTVTQESVTVARTPSATEEQISPPDTHVLAPKEESDDTDNKVLVSDAKPKKEKSEKEAVKTEKKNNKQKAEAKSAPQSPNATIVGTQTKPVDQTVNEKPNFSDKQENKASAPSHVKTDNKEISKEKTTQKKEPMPSFTPSAESAPTDFTERYNPFENKDKDKDKAEKQDIVPEYQEKKPEETARGDVPKKEPFKDPFLQDTENVSVEDRWESIEKEEKNPQNTKDFFFEKDGASKKDDVAFEKNEENQKDNADHDDDDRPDEEKKPVTAKGEASSKDETPQRDDAPPKDDAPPRDDAPPKDDAPKKEASSYIPSDKEPQKPSQAPMPKPKENASPTENKPIFNPQGGNEKPASPSPKPEPPTGGGKRFSPED